MSEADKSSGVNNTHRCHSGLFHALSLIFDFITQNAQSVSFFSFSWLPNLDSWRAKSHRELETAFNECLVTNLKLIASHQAYVLFVVVKAIEIRNESFLVIWSWMNHVLQTTVGVHQKQGIVSWWRRKSLLWSLGCRQKLEKQQAFLLPKLEGKKQERKPNTWRKESELEASHVGENVMSYGNQNVDDAYCGSDQSWSSIL